MSLILLTARRFGALAVLSFCAACAAPEPELEMAARRGGESMVPPVVPAPGVPGTATRDLDDDGFISAREAAGYYARRFGALDQDGDALLSREEIARDLEGLADPDAAFAALDLDTDLQISQDEYFQANAQKFRQKVDPSSGMMSSTDFDTMIRYKDPLVSDQLNPEVDRDG